MFPDVFEKYGTQKACKLLYGKVKGTLYMQARPLILQQTPQWHYQGSPKTILSAGVPLLISSSTNDLTAKEKQLLSYL